MLGERIGGLWALGRPAVMGILNITPDSFSDGGRFADPAAALEQAEGMLGEGADVLDVGGESTRPGAQPVEAEMELKRVVPVIEAVVARHPQALVSVDTGKAAVARAALVAGAVMVNDVTAGADPEMLPLVAERGVAIVLMHMRGEPRTMQTGTRYDDVVAEVVETLATRAAAAGAAGVAPDNVLLDPGIGFGKDLEGNLRLLAALPDLAALGYPVVVGASRKSFIGKLTGAATGERLPGSLAALAGVCRLPRALVRVHDVAATVQFLKVIAALGRAA